MNFFLLILAVLPVIFISLYVYKKDKNSEPRALLARLFFFGILSCFLTLLLSNVLFKIFPFLRKDTSFMNIYEVLFYSFFGVALVEEFSKWIMVYLAAYNNKSYDECYDGIVYAVFVSLGFAFLENIIYVFGNYSIRVAIMRALLAVPGHACDAVFMGYYFSMAKAFSHDKEKNNQNKFLFLSLLAPTLLHGIYDFCLFSGVNILIFVFLIFVFLLLYFSIKKISQLAKKSSPILKNNKNTNKVLNNNISNRKSNTTNNTNITTINKNSNNNFAGNNINSNSINTGNNFNIDKNMNFGVNGVANNSNNFLSNDSSYNNYDDDGFKKDTWVFEKKVSTNDTATNSNNNLTREDNNSDYFGSPDCSLGNFNLNNFKEDSSDDCSYFE